MKLLNRAQEITETLRDSVRNYSLQLNRVDADLLGTQAALGKQAKYSAIIREIEMAILELKSSIIQLQEALDVTSLGQLSSVLISPHNLSVILQQVSLQLPAGLSMLTGLTVQEMYVYYTTAMVHTVATSTSIRLFVDIPLKATDRYFELYQVHSLPFFYEKIGRFVTIDEPFVYLAVAETRQFFAILTPYMLTKCTQELYTVCPLDVMLKTTSVPDCLIALFLGKTDIMFSRCQRLLLNETFEPVWICSPDASYCIYSFSTPQRVTVQCQEVGSPPTTVSSSQMLLEGTGILPNSSSCYVYAENFKLLPHSVGKTTVSLTKTHIVLPIVENILQSSEEIVLQPDMTSSVTSQRLDEILTRATSRRHLRGAEVTRVVNTLLDEDVPQQPTSWLWFAIFIVQSIVIGSLWPIWFKCIKVCYTQMRRRMATSAQPPATSIVQGRNTCETELQIAEREQGTSADAVRDSNTLTGFVQHGVVIADCP